MSESDLLNQLNTQFMTLEQRIQQTFNLLSGTVPVAMGPIGNTGSQGQTGQTGTQGVPGTQGSTGPSGGPIGAQGLLGPQGLIGPIGNQGFQGPLGNTGSQGLTGPIGNQGVQGPIGSGSQGAQGQAGPTGPQGLIGVQGRVGAGTQGVQGQTGSQGQTGPQGLSILGPTGATGFTGTQGIKGDLGGSFSWNGIYNSGTTYAINDTFFYQGSSYIYAASAPSPFAITTIVSTGLNYPTGLAIKSDGTLYIADNQNHVIKMRDVSGNVTIYAGSTQGFVNSINPLSARFNNPYGLELDTLGNLYVADRGNNMIRRITPGGVVTTVAGQLTPGFTNGLTTAANFNSPSGLAVDSAFNIYVADTNNNVIRIIDSNGNVATYAGSQFTGSTDGIGVAARFFNPIDVALDPTGTILYVADTKNNLIRKITSGANVVTFAGILAGGHQDGVGLNSSFNMPYSLIVDSFGNVFLADNGNNCIREITPGGNVVTVAGNITLAPDPYNRGSANSLGAATVAAAGSSFYRPSGICIDSTGNLYIADSNNQLIRKGLPTGSPANLALMAQKGDVGPTGPQGLIGPLGTQGLTGPQGLTGSQGNTGVQGFTGAQGFTGSQGITGSQGATGSTGAQGFTGPTGTQGDAGSQGVTGTQGPIGLPGTNAGFTGAQGAGPYTTQGYFNIATTTLAQPYILNIGTQLAPVFWLNATGVYQISIFSYTNGTYFFATLGVYKTASGFQSVFMGVTSFQLTLNLTSGPSITASLTINGIASGNYYWSIALSAPYTDSIA